MTILGSPSHEFFFAGDKLVFQEEFNNVNSILPALDTWTVLIIDDDDQVHQSTVFALGDEAVLGRRLVFIHAKNGCEAIAISTKAPDVAFVDMVMECAYAGLRFADTAKADNSWCSIKILFRSGQFGFNNDMEQARAAGVEGFAQKQA